MDSSEDRDEKVKAMKRVTAILFFVLIAASSASGAGKDLEVHGRVVVSKTPSFSLTVPSDLQWVHSASADHPEESSVTQTFLLVKEGNKEIEEMLIVQIADKTNPQAGPMVVPPMKPYAEKKMYLKGKVQKGEIGVESMIQLMAWNPAASSLQPIVQKGMKIPSHWALQTQILFQPRLESAVSLRYSKDIHSFGLKVSDEGKNWDQESISGNEKKVYESFRNAVSRMIESLRFQAP